jgi:uncharacterized protein (TIGR03790 family)
MAKPKSIAWLYKSAAAALMVLIGVGRLVSAQPPEIGHAASVATASDSAASAAGVASSRGPAANATGLELPGGLLASQLGLVINLDDPYSVDIGDYYRLRRRIRADHVLQLRLPVQAGLSEAEFDHLVAQISAHFGPEVQALALAWREPYAVQCNSITGALALGFDRKLCLNPCERSRHSPYFAAMGRRPFSEHGIRPAMLIAAPTVAQARALIDRGIRADGSLGLRGAPPAKALFVTSHDAARNVRATAYPPAGLIEGKGIAVVQIPIEQLGDQQRVLVVQVGAAQVPQIDSLGWLPGALADHLTSFGGELGRSTGQMSAMAWIAAGATASYGSVSEPCNHLQKFPNPKLLLLNYMFGQTAIEAYWKSVDWPQQGLFIGEPLAAPFASRSARAAAAP